MLTALQHRVAPRGRAPDRARVAATSTDAVATDLLRLRVVAGAAGADEDGLSGRCRRALRVATAVGAPLLDAVDGAAAAEDDQRRAARAVQVASAQTKAVAVGLVAAPVLLVPGLGRLVGGDLVGFYTTGLGLAVLAVGLVLLGTGALIVTWLARRVGRPGAERRQGGGAAAALAAVAGGWLAWRLVGPVLVPLAALFAHHAVSSRREPRSADLTGLDEAADLAATALAGGVSTPHALRLAAEQLPDLAAPLHRLAFELELGLGSRPRSHDPVRGRMGSSRLHAGSGDEPAPLERMRVVLTTATEVGAAAAPTLRRLARDLRADELARVLAAAERLPAQLTFPTALCLLPATVLLIGAPIVHAGLAGAGL